MLGFLILNCWYQWSLGEACREWRGLLPHSVQHFDTNPDSCCSLKGRGTHTFLTKFKKSSSGKNSFSHFTEKMFLSYTQAKCLGAFWTLTDVTFLAHPPGEAVAQVSPDQVAARAGVDTYIRFTLVSVWREEKSLLKITDAMAVHSLTGQMGWWTGQAVLRADEKSSCSQRSCRFTPTGIFGGFVKLLTFSRNESRSILWVACVCGR